MKHLFLFVLAGIEEYLCLPSVCQIICKYPVSDGRCTDSGFAALPVQ